MKKLILIMSAFFILNLNANATTNEKDGKICSGFAKWTKEGEFKIIRSNCITKKEYQANLNSKNYLCNYYQKSIWKESEREYGKKQYKWAEGSLEKIKALKEKPYLNKEKNQSDIIKELNKQYEKLLVNSILEDKSKNTINDISVNNIKVRFQKIKELPFKDLRSLIDSGKKELNNGVVVVYAIKDNKIGLAVGVTQKLSKKIDAVDLVKIGSEIIGGKGGGGRADFAQAGGSIVEKIDESFEKIKSLIN